MEMNEVGQDELGVFSSDEEELLDERKHERLLETVNELDGLKRNKTLRNEAATEVSEFNIASGDKVKLHEMLAALKHTASHGDLKKQINRLQKKSKSVTTPLPKYQQERAERTVGYESTKKDISKWEPIIEKNRKADQIKYPLDQPDLRMQRTTEQMIKQFQPRTPLEMEVAALLHGSDHNLKSDKILTAAEEKALRAMSLEEAQKRRAELQKYRALLSYKQAKERRQNKIKSKQYHRILRKEKLKKEKRALEELQQKDPEAYIEVVSKMDKDRIQERMSLKHRGGSKFMKRQAVFGKYDDEKRNAVQEMIQTNKALTQKTAVESESDGVSDQDDETLPTEEFSSTAKPSADANPWMVKYKYKKPSNRPANSTSAFAGASSTEITHQGTNSEDQVISSADQNNSVLEENEEDEEDAEPADESEQSDGNDEGTALHKSIDDIFNGLNSNPRGKIAREPSKAKKSKPSAKTRHMKERPKRGVTEQRDDGSSMSEDESESDAPVTAANPALEPAADNYEDGISSSLVRKRTLDDFQEGWDDAVDRNDTPTRPGATAEAGGSSAGDKDPAAEVRVDPKKFLTMETSLRQPHLPKMADDSDGEMDAEEQQRMTIAQAFAADDVIEEFAKEKEDIEKSQKVKDIDLTLPGWGDWGGSGLKTSKRKRKRFRIKAPEGPPRRDKGLREVIISEKKDNTVAKHQVSELPFPFTSVHQFESSIRQPIGKTWVPETAFKQLVKPKVVTRLGTIIDPIDKAETFKKQKVKHDGKDGKSGGGARGKGGKKKKK